MIGTAPRARPSLGRAAGLVIGMMPFVAWLLWQPVAGFVSPAFGWVLCFVAIAAELAAIDTGLRGARLACTAVYVGAIAWFWSPGLAIGVAIVAAACGSIVRRSLWKMCIRDRNEP